MNLLPAESAVLRTAEAQLEKMKNILAQAKAAVLAGQTNLSETVLYLSKQIADSEKDIAEFKALRGVSKTETTADIIQKALAKANLKPKKSVDN
jgi:hypothetical protein